jgi:hypothetical protein
MAILGWLFCAMLMGSVSMCAFLMMLNNLGEYNIGGVPNYLPKKLLTLAFVVFVGYLWYLWVISAPFSITFTI